MRSRWRFSAEEIISARRSALVEHEQCKKASWLGVKDIHEVNLVDLHPSLVGDMQENFQAMSDDRAVFENVPSTVLQPKSACASCLEVCGGNHWKSCGERVCVMLVGLLKAWGNGYCSCWTTWYWFSVLQSAEVELQISTTLVARSVSSLLLRSPFLSAKIIWWMSHLVQSVTVQSRTLILINVG